MRWVRKILQWMHPLLKGAYSNYSQQERSFTYKGLKITVLPGVFHPGLFHSTKTILQFLDQEELKGKTVLELGAGTGLIALYASQLGAISWASDISSVAIKNVLLNAEQNAFDISVVESDLFADIHQEFDYIIVNPPYYPKQPQTESEMAWYCGEQFEYFQNFFSTLAQQIQPQTKVLMVLSEDCDLDRIKDIAQEADFSLSEVFSRTSWGERNYLFRISH